MYGSDEKSTENKLTYLQEANIVAEVTSQELTSDVLDHAQTYHISFILLIIID
jgi:hypothetical protein